MEDKKILLKWYPLKNMIETKGHQMPNGWWYIYLPFDKEWHFVPNDDVIVIRQLNSIFIGR